MRNYVMEFIGTFFLVIAIGLTGDPLAIGLMLMVMVYMGGHISGAHYNPVVTISFWRCGKLPAREILPYVASQLLGAMAAAGVCHLLQGKTFAISPSASATISQVLLVEVLFTFALVSVILVLVATKALEGNQIYGLTIGLTVTAIAYAGGGISGGAYNPAVGLGPNIVDTIMGGSSLGQIWYYLLGPFVGGAIADLVFRYLNPPE